MKDIIKINDIVHNCNWILYNTCEIAIKTSYPIILNKTDTVIICDVKRQYVIEIDYIISITQYCDSKDYHTTINFQSYKKEMLLVDIPAFIRTCQIEQIIG